jgi:hypothetical protein
MASPTVAAALESVTLNVAADSGPERIHFLRACTRLTELTVYYSMCVTEVLLVCTGVRTLSLYACKFTGSALLACTNLRKLILGHCDLTPEVMASVAALPHLTELRVKPFEASKHAALQHLITDVDVGATAATLGSGFYPRLRRLQWDGREDPYAASITKRLPRMPALQELRLSGISMDEACLHSIVGVVAAAGIQLLMIVPALQVPVSRERRADLRARLRKQAPWMQIEPS